MSLELTAKLTLSSCVSQLTDFYLTTIQDKFVENGIQPVTITTCDNEGEVLPFTIYLEPIGQTTQGSYNFQGLKANVYLNDMPNAGALFNSVLEKGGMNVRNIFQCALHLCGDYIKFYTKGGY